MSAVPTANEAAGAVPAAPPKRSGTEVIKEASHALRGDIAAELLQV